VYLSINDSFCSCENTFKVIVGDFVDFTKSNFFHIMR
jgi:hypothetical protein